MNTTRLINLIAILILIALSVTNIYRAKTQSITCDEAYSYELWTSQPLSRMFVAYDTGNHVVQNMLSKISVAALGLSELTLRLPSLLAGFLYFIAIYRISRLVFGADSLFLLSVCVLSLDPLLLDLLSAARGYALALAFCTWALYYMLKGPPAIPLSDAPASDPTGPVRVLECHISFHRCGPCRCLRRNATLRQQGRISIRGLFHHSRNRSHLDPYRRDH